MEQKLDTQYERYKTCDGKLSQASSDVARITKSNEENKKKLESCEKEVEEKEDENEELQGNVSICMLKYFLIPVYRNILLLFPVPTNPVTLSVLIVHFSF